ncbi:MAG: hypothetical protein WC500_02420 [Candidatus Margulisiibacteriota bacterium]
MKMDANKFHLFFFFLLISFCLLTGCGIFNNSSAKSTYYPHNDNYSWRYKQIIVGPTNEVVTGYSTIYFSGVTTLPNGVVVQNQYSSNESTGNTFNVFFTAKKIMISSALCSYITANDSGVFSYGTATNPTTEGFLIISFPLSVGQKWEGRYGSCEVEVEESIAVMGRVQKAMKIRIQGDIYLWYVENIGLVKTIIPDIPIVDSNGLNERKVDYVEELVEINF